MLFTPNYNLIRKNNTLNANQRKALSSLVSICYDNTRIENLVKTQCYYCII